MHPKMYVQSTLNLSWETTNSGNQQRIWNSLNYFTALYSPRCFREMLNRYIKNRSLETLLLFCYYVTSCFITSLFSLSIFVAAQTTNIMTKCNITCTNVLLILYVKLPFTYTMCMNFQNIWNVKGISTATFYILGYSLELNHLTFQGECVIRYMTRKVAR